MLNEAFKKENKVIVILPAFNEADAIKPMLENLSYLLASNPTVSNIIIVDDGSTDNTVDIVKAYKDMAIELIEHGYNRGLGMAIKTGFLSALRIAKDDDVIITMDADNTHSPHLIPRMSAYINEGNDVVIASRYTTGARVFGVSKSRRLYSLGASLLFRILFPTAGVKDYTSGYRAYRAGKLKEAFRRWGESFINMSGFSCMVDILLKLRDIGSIMIEVPIILRYDLKVGESKMDVKKTIKETLLLVFRRYNAKI